MHADLSILLVLTHTGRAERGEMTLRLPMARLQGTLPPSWAAERHAAAPAHRRPARAPAAREAAADPACVASLQTATKGGVGTWMTMQRAESAPQTAAAKLEAEQKEAERREKLRRAFESPAGALEADPKDMFNAIESTNNAQTGAFVLVGSSRVRGWGRALKTLRHSCLAHLITDSSYIVVSNILTSVNGRA